MISYELFYLYDTAQAAVHLLRACINDKEPFGHVVPTVHSEPVVNDGDRRGRLRAMTDAAVMASPRRDLISDVVPGLTEIFFEFIFPFSPYNFKYCRVPNGEQSQHASSETYIQRYR